MTQLDELIKRAERRARDLGGLVAILLLIRKGMTRDIKWKNGNFVVNNHEVKPKEINQELNRIELKIAHTFYAYNERLMTGQWTLDQWKAAMEALVSDTHVLFGALAVGSIAAAATSELVARKIERDKIALVRFARAIRIGHVKTPNKAYHRSRAYIKSAFVTFHLLSQQQHIRAGYTHAKRILSQAEHCRTTL
jgi:hypothetical protein